MSEDTNPAAIAVFESNGFREDLLTICLESVRTSLPIEASYDREVPRWNYALFCASVLTSVDSEHAQDAVLRVAQAALQHESAAQHHRDAAAVLLERAGNRLTLRLAQRRDLVADRLLPDAPAPLILDVIRRRLDLTIALSGDKYLEATSFQRDFWSAAAAAQWMSLSAPTSAGKSYIIKQWFAEAATTIERFNGVYVVPTRALVEEVSDDLRAVVPPEVSVISLPWDSVINERQRQIFVVTQERLHLVQHLYKPFKIDLLFVDEAQKFNDGDRGILLEQVVDSAVRTNPQVRAMFASPMASNPEMLLQAAPQQAQRRHYESTSVTVNQNLIFVNQVPRRTTQWTADLVLHDRRHLVGTFTLPARPSPDSKRLTLVAVALGRDSSGNVIYVNRPSDAETAAKQVYEALGPQHDVSTNPFIQELKELVELAVHPRYALIECLDRGVAFHYGNMPLAVKAQVERLFKAGHIKYLVCTSTLLEGVNLPCQNLFIRKPQKGAGKAMSPADFWNLAGRAGRWGKEFQGNIVCIDTDKKDTWKEVPTRRVKRPLERRLDRVLRDDLEALQAYVTDGTPVAAAAATPGLESTFSLLASVISDGRSLSELPGVVDASELASVIERSLMTVEAEAALISRHAGISPISMQRLLDHFRSSDLSPDELSVALPEDSDAQQVMHDALSRVEANLGGGFGGDGRQWQLANLLIGWMRGYPLSQMINQRYEFSRSRDASVKLASVIRSVLDDVENVARFLAPKYLSCYLDVLAMHRRQLGLEDDHDIPDVTMLLELGVSRVTEVSLMSIGLSRTAAIALSELIVQDALTPGECRAWLTSNDLTGSNLPALVLREIADVVGQQIRGETESL